MSRKSLVRCTPEEVGIPSEAIIDLVKALDSFDGSEMHGIMIMRHGKVCAEGWWQPFAPGRAHICWSLGKTYTATGIGILITQGKLSLDTRVIDIFPELTPKASGENLKKLCVRHLLTMSCGMREMGPEGYGWLPNFLKMKVDYEPGTVFMYNSMGTNTLGAIIKRVSGLEPEEFFRKELYEKIGMNTEQCYWTPIPDGYIWAAGGVFSTTENNLRLMQLYLQNGVWDGERILSEEYVNLATTLQIDNSTGYNPEGELIPQFESHQGYGYQIWMNSYKNSYRADGAQGQYAIVFKDEDMVIAINQTLEKNTDEYLNLIFESFLPRLQREPLEENKEACGRLRRYLSKLAIPAPIHRELSPMAEAIHNKTFIVESGAFTFLTAFEPREFRNTGIRVSDGIKSFTMRFSESRCQIDYVENEERFRADIALDGTRCEATLKVKNHMPSKVLLSGAWVEKNVFQIKARWIESTVEKTAVFVFDRDRVDITAKLTLGMLGAYKNPEEIAAARLQCI